jgi:hypothetical protein
MRLTGDTEVFILIEPETEVEVVKVYKTGRLIDAADYMMCVGGI